MNNKKRSAFTIVELVIVIAVIAILSAVLIPTFGAIIKDANIAADHTAASTLTTELHLELKGETIDSELELMEYMDKIDPKKLTPKAAAYGVHFWFDMETQMIIAATAAEIDQLIAERNSGSGAVPTGAQLMNTVTASAETPINTSLRELRGGGFFFVDKGDGKLVKALDAIAEFDYGKTHAELLADVAAILVDVVRDDQACVDQFKAALASTTIITSNGVVQPTTAEHVYFEPGIKFVNDFDPDNIISIPSITSGTLVLPSTVIGVAPGALVFGGEITLVTSCKDVEDVQYVFANASTNATIKTSDGGSYKIANEACKPTVDEANDGLANRLVSTDTIDPATGVAPSYVPNIILSNKLEHMGFKVNVDTTGLDANKIFFDDKAEIPTLYVSYKDYAVIEEGVDKSIALSLLADDGKTVIPGEHSAITWTVDDAPVTHKVSVTNDTTIVTAKARNVEGETVTGQLKIIVNKANFVNVAFGDSEAFSVPGPLHTQSFTWVYDESENADILSVVFSNLKYNYNDAKGTPKYTITDVTKNASGELLNAGLFTYDATNGTISIAKNEDGTIKLATDNGKTVNDYTLEVAVDGLHATMINVTVKDSTNARLVSKFNNTSMQNYYWYIGNGSVTLGDILKLKNENDLPYDSNIAVYVENNDEFLPVFGVSTFGIDTATTSTEFTSNDWQNAVINLTKGVEDKSIQIRLTPKGVETLGEDKIIAISLRYKNATNVATKDALKTAVAANGNVVMMSNIKLADTDNTGNYSLTISDGETLYGNGFVIEAPKYTSVTKVVTGKTGCYETNQALITLEGGTVDNIYIAGPVYADLTYRDNLGDATNPYTDGAYHVAGIKFTGDVDGNLKNSYVAGFRTPVRANGDAGKKLTITNSVLHGGTYANLELASGDLTLDNVTTIQDTYGVKATVGTDTNRMVLGMGIMIGDGALRSNIIIKQQLNQYNWIASDIIGKVSLPTIEGVDMAGLIDRIFRGIVPDGILGAENNYKMHRFLDYIHGHSADGNNTQKLKNTQYINAGIMYAKMGTTAEIESWSSSQPLGLEGCPALVLNPTQTDRDYAANSLNESVQEQLTPIQAIRLRKALPDALKTLLTAFDIDAMIDEVVGEGNDAILLLWSYRDGIRYKFPPMNSYFDKLKALTKVSNASYDRELHSGVTESTIRYTDTNYFRLTYSGYYDASGIYSTWYGDTTAD